MTLTQIDFQIRAPYEYGDDGYYYWCNTYYADWDGSLGSSSPIYKLSVVFEACWLPMAELNWHRETQPPHSGIQVFEGTGFNNPGEATHADSTILENVARVSCFVGERYVGYKLLRAVVGPDEVVDGVIDPTVVAFLQGNYADQLVVIGCTTADGTPYTSCVVDSRIHHWNLRHGTKRRARGVIHNP